MTIDYRRGYDDGWSEEEFPLTPMECWFIMRGWAVRPQNSVNAETVLTMPGHLEMFEGYIMLCEG